MITNAITSGQHALFSNRESLKEQEVTLATSTIHAKRLVSAVGKVAIALVFASMIGGISIAPAFGDNRHDGYNGRGHGYDRRGYQYHRYYPPPVYAPPPVIYAPAPYQSPGISLVFPIVIR